MCAHANQRFLTFLVLVLAGTGIFDDSGVVHLNNRAEEMMDRLGVPIVKGYDITGGQSWATPTEDGR